MGARDLTGPNALEDMLEEVKNPKQPRGELRHLVAKPDFATT